MSAPGELPGHLRSRGGSSKSFGTMVSHVLRGALTARFGVRGARPRPTAMHRAAPPKDCMARCHAEHQRAEARQANIGRMPMVRVKTEPALVLRRCTAPRRRTIAWHDAMPSTSGRRPAKRKRQDAVFVVKTSTVFVVKTSAVFVVKTSAVFVVHQSGGGASVSKWARRIAEKSVPEPSAYRRRAESGAVWPSRRTSAR